MDCGVALSMPSKGAPRISNQTPTGPSIRSLGLRPLRPLLPKNDEPKPKGPLSQALPRQRGCGLSQCPNPDCVLKSHRMYSLTMRQRRSPDEARRRRARPASTQWTDGFATWVDRRLYDGMPQLPEGTSQLIESKQLFHHFFTQQMERVRQIYVPFLEPDVYRETSLRMSLSSAMHCVCVLANAKTDIIMRRLSNTPDRGSYAVYSLASGYLRRRLDKFSRDEIDQLLMLVVALAGLDYAFKRFDALNAHRDALEKLVAMQGGLQIVDSYQGQVVAFVSKTDHMLATSLGKPALFNREYGSLTLDLPDTPSGKYGAVWRQPVTKESIDEDVTRMCLNSCRLFHMAETEGITFYQDVAEPSTTDSLPYFVFLRGCIGVDYSRLYTLYHPNQTSDPNMYLSKSRCLVYTCVLTDYNILWGDYYPIYRHRKATMLMDILRAQPKSTWDEHRDMLMWMYFVLTTAVPRSWEGHKEAVDILRDMLIRKYGSQWPLVHGWQEKELDNLRQHMWSELAYNASFRLTCTELSGGNEKKRARSEL